LPSIERIEATVFTEGQEQKTPAPAVSKEKEGELRKTYSAELSSKTSESTRKLIDDAINTKNEPVTRFILLELAYKHAGDIFDFDGAFKAIDKLDDFHSDVNPIAIKLRILDDAQKKKPKAAEVVEGILNAYLELAVLMANLGAKNTSYYETAANAAKNAEDNAKLLKNKALEDKSNALGKYSKDLNKDKNDLITLAKLRYFILGVNDEEVLKALAEGPDARLKRFLGLSFLAANSPEGNYELADAAYDAANESGRIPHEKRILQGKSLELYKSALSSATGVAKTKYERDEKLKKRMAELERVGSVSSSAIAIDLLKLIDPKRDAVKGDWSFQGATLVSAVGDQYLLQVPYVPPEEYDLLIAVERKKGASEFRIGLSSGDSQFHLAFDGYGGTGSGIAAIDGKHPPDNETCRKGPIFANDKVQTFLCSVRKGSVLLTLDGKKFLEWKGDFKRLSGDSRYPHPNPEAILIGAWSSEYQISKMILTPVSGSGKRLR
jgi:hypothetical protein